MAKKEKKRLFFRIANELEQEIIAENYKLGQKIPTEKELSDIYGVSRSVIREAILALEIKGYVEARAGSGVVVVKAPPSILKTTEHEIGPFELLQARQVFEREAAALAATQVTRRDLIRLQRILESGKEILREASRNNKFYLQDEEFHMIIAKASNNLAVMSTIHHLWQLRAQNGLWNKFSKKLENTVVDHRQAQKDHEEIFNALVQKSPAKAREAMNAHLTNIQKLLLNFTQSQNNSFDAHFFSEELPLTWEE